MEMIIQLLVRPNVSYAKPACGVDPQFFLSECKDWLSSPCVNLSEVHFGIRGGCSGFCIHSWVAALCSQVKGRAVKIRPKTKDWLKGLQEEIIRKRDSMISMSPTANSFLLEENFDFTSLDYESEGE